jgi:transposase-like protein
LAAQLVERARAEGVDLVGPGGLLTGLTKTVLETALEAEMSEHLGYDKHDPAGRTGNQRMALTFETDPTPYYRFYYERPSRRSPARRPTPPL